MDTEPSSMDTAAACSVTNNNVSSLNTDIVPAVAHMNVNKNIRIFEWKFLSHFYSHFEDIKLKGEGGFGQVFDCRHIFDTKRYAVKRIPVKPNGDAIKAQKEARALATLEHPHIVEYFHSWSENPPPGWQDQQDTNYFGYSFPLEDSSDDATYSIDNNKENQVSSSLKTYQYLYLKMELCLDKTLREYIDEKNAPMIRGVLDTSYNHAKRFMLQIADAVKYMHANNWMHRDLKPSNIFFSAKVGEYNHIKVGDFGLATLSTRSTEACPLTPDVGTFIYMSPELRNNSTYSPKVDIYSLGVIFIELMMNIPTRQELIKIVREKQFLIPGEDWDNEYVTLCKNMISADPDERPTASTVWGILTLKHREESPPPSGRARPFCM